MTTILNQGTRESRMVKLVGRKMARSLETAGLVEPMARVSDVDTVSTEMQELRGLNNPGSTLPPCSSVARPLSPAVGGMAVRLGRVRQIGGHWLRRGVHLSSCRLRRLLVVVVLLGMHCGGYRSAVGSLGRVRTAAGTGLARWPRTGARIRRSRAWLGSRALWCARERPVGDGYSER